MAAQLDCLAVLKLHHLRWVLFPIETDFDKYTDDAVALFSATGLRS
jgi:hypothetical protein